jgi:zinc protease
MTYAANPDCYKDYVRRIREATPAAVHKAMVAWLSDGDYVLNVTPYPDVEAAATAPAFDRKAGVPVGQPQALKMPPLQQFTLANGLKVLVAERHTAPVVNFSMLVDSGYAADPKDMAGLSTLTLNMMEEGTATRSADRISEELEALGATFRTSANLDAVSVNINALRTTLPRALDVYSDIILRPAFPAAELERVRASQLAAIANEKSDPSEAPMRVLGPLLFGKDHAYARPLTGTGTEAAVKRITRDDLAKFHSAWFRPNNATLIVVGDTTVAEIKPLLEKSFGGWAKGDVPAKNIAPVQPPQKAVVYLMDRPGSLQSVIVGAQVAQPKTPEELVRLQLVNGVLGGSFSSRMNMNLREDKHWSYGVYSYLSPTVSGQRILISQSPVQTDKTVESFKEITTEYTGVAGARPITPEELQQIKEKETLALPGKFETAAQLTQAYTNIVEYRLPQDYYARFTPTALALTPAQANEIARRDILADRQVWIVVGDMAKVADGIRKLNIGEVHRIDADGRVID